MRRLGKRIRKRREMLDLHLNDLAKRIGITHSALSQIENAKTFPSIITLKAIAEQLHTTVGELIGENETLGKNPIVKHNDIKLINTSSDGIQTFSLAVTDTNNMDPYLIKIPPQKSIHISKFHLFSSMPNQQIFCHVLNGYLVIILNEIQYTLEKGDNVYFVQPMFEELINSSQKTAEIYG